MVAIRMLFPADAAAYHAARNQGLKECPDAFTTSYEEAVATPLEVIAKRISGNGDDFVLGAFDGNNELVGYAGFQREGRVNTRHKGKIAGMYVLPEQRCTGLGRRLISDLIARVRTIEGMEMLALTVTHSNAGARNLYLSEGFVSFGVEPNAIKVDGIFYAKEHMTFALT